MKAQTAVLLAVVVVGGIVIWKLASPAASSSYHAPANTSVVGTAGLISAASSLFGRIVASQPSSSSGVSYNVTPAAGGQQYVTPTTSNEQGGNTGTGGYGIAGLDYAI